MVNVKVLFVNEDKVGVEIYGTLLKHLGYDVYTAIGGEAAVEAAAVIRPAIIVTELKERTVRGWRTPELLKGNAKTRNVPLVALTAWTSPEDRERAMASGCDLFLPKPTTPSELAEIIHDAIAPAH
jgi:two-component system, cell cycle response regulator DivK